MPFRFSFDELPGGVALSSALDGEMLSFSTRLLLSTEDGSDFISHIEAIWGFFSEALRPSGISPSQVDHFLAVIDRNKTATLYLNELQQEVLVRAKRGVQRGQPCHKDDIAEIEELVLLDAEGRQIEIFPNDGLVLIMSVGWRKCLYYDFEVLVPESPPRSVNLPRLFGQLYRQLFFRELYSITEDQWSAMRNWCWFPFMWMTQEDRNKIICFSTRLDEPKQLFEEVCENYKAMLKERSQSWHLLASFNEHSSFIEKAVEHHLNGDYLSAIQVLYPRIEGIMRRLHLLNSPGSSVQQRTMVEAVVKGHDEYSILFPAQFRKYLNEFYFRAFNESTGDLPLSRNSVAHGTSLPSDYDFVKSSLGFMICDQIFFFLGPLKGQPSA